MSISRQCDWVWGMAFCIFAATMPITASVAFVKINNTGFSLTLGNNVRTIQLTSEYKEAALMATLPIFSDFAQKLNLPVPHPLTRSDIIDYGVTPFQKNDGEIDTVVIKTKQGFSFSFFQGIVSAFSSPDSYSAMQDVHVVSRYFGAVKITRAQAVQSARETLSKIGINPADLFAEQEPQVELPIWGTNTIDRFLIKWSDPRGDVNAKSVEMEVNGKTGRIEHLWLSPENGLKRNAPKLAVVAAAGHDRFDSMIPPSMSPAYAWKLIPMMLAAIDAYARKLTLPIPCPVLTNSVAKIEAYNNDGWPHCEIWLTNGWRFVYRHAMVNGYYAPGNFFDSDDRSIRIRDFNGRWKLSTNDAIQIVSQAMAKLHYPTNNVHMDFQPKCYVASVDAEHIPRLRFEWYYSVQTELQSRLEAEVNMDSGTLESLYYDDKAYWGSRPPINVPICTGNEKGR